MKYYFSYNFIIETAEKIADSSEMYKSAAEILAAKIERHDIHSIADDLELWDTETEEEYA